MRTVRWLVVLALLLPLTLLTDHDLSAGGVPGERAWHTGTWTSNGLYVFGGLTGEGESNDLLRLTFTTNPPTWQLMPTGETRPSPRRGASLSLAPDGLGSGLFLFGGVSDGVYLNDLWEYDTGSGNWTAIDRGPPPPPRAYHAAAHAGGQMLVFGGETTGGALLADTWALKGFPIGVGWTPLFANGPPPGRRHATAAWSPTYGMMMWGGEGPAVNGQVWVLTSNQFGADWAPYPSNGTPPPVRAGHGTIWDVDRARFVVFGGGDPPLADAHAYAPLAASWSPLTPASPQGTPSPRRHHAMAYTSGPAKLMLVVSGSYGDPSSPALLADTWALDWSGSAAGTWVPLAGVVLDVESATPLAGSSRLSAVTPNPSRGVAHSILDLARGARVTAAVHDLAGRRVRDVHDGPLAAGRHRLEWSLERGAPAGVYLLRVAVDGVAEARRFAVLR